MNPQTASAVAAIAAAIAAVFSAIAAGFSVYLVWRGQRTRADISIIVGTLLTPGEAPLENQIGVFIANTGLVPINVTHFAANVLENGKRQDIVILLPGLPKLLAVSERMHSGYPIPEEYAALKFRRIFVTDSAGRSHYMPRMAVKHFNKRIADHAKAELLAG